MLLSTFISWLWLGFEITPGFSQSASMVLRSMGSRRSKLVAYGTALPSQAFVHPSHAPNRRVQVEETPVLQGSAGLAGAETCGGSEFALFLRAFVTRAAPSWRGSRSGNIGARELAGSTFVRRN